MHNVLYATDANYWMHLYVSMYSLLKNNGKSKFTVYIFTDEANEVFIDNLSFLYELGNLADCIIIEVDSSVAEAYPLGDFDYFTKAIYYRLFMGQLLPEEVKIILYLDCDTIIDGPIDELFKIVFDRKTLAAVHDKGSLNDSKRLKLPNGVSYFNSGVLLVNIERWRSLNVECRILSYIEKNPDILRFPDQDALNAVLFDEYININPQFNFHEWGSILQIEGTNAIEPIIIHYVDCPKPWYYLSDHPLKEKYWSYLKETPYRDYRETDRNLKNYFVMLIYCLKKGIIGFSKKRQVLYKLLLKIKRFMQETK